MANPSPRPTMRGRGSSSRTPRWSSFTSNGSANGSTLRRDSIMSNSSFVSDVEMAQEEVFDGPISESVPSSVTGFAHRRPRTDSVASFTYFQAEDESPEWSDDQAVAVEDDLDLEDDALRKSGHNDAETHRSFPSPSPRRRKSSGYSRSSAEQPLLHRLDSSKTENSFLTREARSRQKIYVESEDLTIVVAGFSTSIIGFAIYLGLCICSAGLLYLLFRWMPRWRVRLVGTEVSLRECRWTVIENQWGEFEVQNVSRIPYGHSVSTVFGPKEKDVRYHNLDEDEDPVIEQLRILDYRYVRFCFHPLEDKFAPCSSWKDPDWTDVRSMRTGLDSDERQRREKVFDKNQIDIKEKNIPQLLVDEVLHPFYIFQAASLVLWSLDEYYYYAICIFVISLISITTTLVETRSTMKRLREISRFECEIRVLRNGFWRQVNSPELVPGDVYEVSDPSLAQFPCDSLLLAGDCIVNESMLTGESIPVSKIPATDESLKTIDLSANTMTTHLAKHFLFSGTKVIRARRPQEGPDEEAVALAIVIRTGFNTTKGSLVRSMVFPKPSDFKFYKDAFLYISVMATIAGIGFITSFITFVKLKLAWHLIIVRALDLITIVVPPALPATLTIGTNFALSRLRKKNIFCISPQRINVGGKLDVVCFDKTGTLTEDGLDVLGVRVNQEPAMRFSDVFSDVSSLLPGAEYERDPTVDYRIHQAILYTMATCHSLRAVDGEILGDPLDVKMFEFTGWSFEEFAQKANVDDENAQDHPASIARPPTGLEYDIDMESSSRHNFPVELGTLKSFDFVAQLRRASVVVGRPGIEGAEVYVKGAPECMGDICDPQSFPTDYDDLLNYYTHRGFRVIACATKHIKTMNWKEVRRMTRQDAESNLRFLGFIIFENKLKEVTAEVIQELNDANIREVMCTGDNILTAISVARECGLIDCNSHCYIPRFIEGGSRDPRARLQWQSVDNALYELDRDTLTPLPAPAEADASLSYDVSTVRDYSIAVSGDVFRWIIDYGNQEVLKRMLVRGQIFARMSPDEKHELVEKLQSIDYCTCFCGDGANDCGALKAADVGISLSEAEASVAAPFTSRVFDISCVPEVIREGRAALVTSFCCFKYMSLYSAIQFTSVSFLYASVSNLGDFQFLFIDICLVLPVAIFMGWTGAFPVLCAKRPTASLVSRKVLVPLLGQILLCVVIQLIGFELVQKQSWYMPPHLDKQKSNTENSHDTILFLLSSFQYIFSGIVLSVGPPFRQPMRHNLPFVITIIVTSLFSAYMLFDPADWLIELMELTFVSVKFRLFLFLLSLIGLVVAWISEKRFFPWLARAIGKVQRVARPGIRKKRKEYKQLLSDMQSPKEA